eukprot:6183872-Pleurochrysis_carterae.AAC.1
MMKVLHRAQDALHKPGCELTTRVRAALSFRTRRRRRNVSRGGGGRNCVGWWRHSPAYRFQKFPCPAVAEVRHCGLLNASVLVQANALVQLSFGGKLLQQLRRDGEARDADARALPICENVWQLAD